ncbi:MAG: hypothetical protein JWP59_3786 [Massilia sp.]|jgi:hypothetical protein|nr:hypothetical protein [Massilia sp.]
MGLVACFCLMLLVATTVIHYEVLRWLTAALALLRIEPRIKPRFKLVFVMVAAFGAHAAEIVLYGAAYYLLATHLGRGSMGETDILTFPRCLYFSAETFTSLGYGDVVPHGDLRLLAGMEALNGLLLIGWTTSYTYISMERFWDAGKDGIRRDHETVNCGGQPARVPLPDEGTE